MRLVKTESLTPGAKLAAPVCTASGKVVLNTGIILNDNYIARVKQLGIQKVYIQDDRFSDVEIEKPLDLTVRNNASRVLRDAYNALQDGKLIDEFSIKNIARNIVDYIREYKEKGVSILSTDIIDEYIIEHSINVAILTAFMGNRMEP